MQNTFDDKEIHCKKGRASHLSSGSNFNMKFILSVISLSLCLSGCIDGFYHLVPNQEIGPQRGVVEGSTVLIQNSTISVRIFGGAPQRPFTKEVDAHWLSVYVEILSKAPFVWDAASASISSAGRLVRSNRAKYAIREPISDQSLSVDSDCQSKWPSSNSSILTIGSGTSFFRFFFEAEDDSLSRFEFPIQLQLGSIIIGADTLSLDSLVFDARRSE